MSQAKQQPMTFEQFLDWERRQERKHEFVDGEPIAMAGASEAHNIIQVNLLVTTAPKLRGSECRPFPSDMLMRTGILLDDTQRVDRTIKLADYNATASIAHYVLIEQRARLVHVYSRGPHGDFNLRPQEIGGPEGVLELPAVGISLTMSEIYDDLELDPIQDEADE